MTYEFLRLFDINFRTAVETHLLHNGHRITIVSHRSDQLCAIIFFFFYHILVLKIIICAYNRTRTRYTYDISNVTCRLGVNSAVARVRLQS